MFNPAEFDNMARCEQRMWWYRGMRRILSGILDGVVQGRRVERVLEAGCGTGYQSWRLGREYGWKMYPMDLGWDGLKYARGMALERLAQADTRALPFPSGSFDMVLSLDVIVHLQRGDEQGALRELARVLKPGGVLILRVAALDALRSRHSDFAMERQRFTRGRLVGLARAAGLRIIRCTYANSLLVPVALAKFRIWEPLLRKPAATGVHPVPTWLDALLYAPLALESICLRAGMRFPIGQSLILVGEK